MPGSNTLTGSHLTKNEHVLKDNALFRKLVENSKSGVTLLDKNLNIVYRSPSAERIGGWNLANRRKNTVEQLTHPDDIPLVKSVMEKVFLNEGTTVECTFRSKHYLGHYIWLECNFTNHLDDPDINGVVCNFHDVSQRKQAEEQLKDSIQELSAYKYALDEASIVAITDQRGVIKHVNDNFCAISKFSREELIGQDHRIINSSYHNKAFIRNLWTTIANGTVWRGELKNKAKDGTYYWVDTTIVPFVNEKGKPYQYVAIRSDITERKLAEEKIIENSRFITTITDNLPAMIAYWTADLRCLFANKPYRDWFNLKQEEIVGISKQSLMDKEDYKSYAPYINNVLKGKAQSFERNFVNNRGKTIYTHTQYLPDKHGNEVKGFYSLLYDVSEVKFTELELQKQTRQVEHLLESITDGFIALDQNMCYTYANTQVGYMLNCEPESLLGKNIWELFPEAVGSVTYKGIEKAFNEKVFVCNEDYYEPLKLWQENRIYPTGSGLSIFIRDITRRKQEEHQLKELNQSLQRQTHELAISNAELEQFAYVASHDLQEPLRMVTGFLTQLERKYVNLIDDRGRQYIHFAVDGAKRMRQIILDLLEFSRVGKSEDKLEDIDLMQLIRDILALYHKQIQEKNASIKFSALPVLHSYKTPLRQVFQNLISNSLKYSRRDVTPVIGISYTQTAKHWQFSVKDNGIGIDPEYFDKIFIIFQRLHNRDEYSGSGMGLAVTKKIVENLGGKIWVDSQEGLGSTFNFTILKSY